MSVPVDSDDIHIVVICVHCDYKYGVFYCICTLCSCCHCLTEMNKYAPQLDMADTDGTKADVYRGFIVTDEETVSLVPELKASDKDEIGGASKQILNRLACKVGAMVGI